MDPHSLEIQRNGKHIGYIQWHDIPLIKLKESHLTLQEIESVVADYRARINR
jgi:hypothetical protein